MLSTTSLIDKLIRDYPGITWQPGETYHWDHLSSTIVYDKDYLSDDYLLHELGHAVLEHEGHSRAIRLLSMERDAWDCANTTLAPKYNVEINQDVEQDALDSYRDWIHSRSTCPNCKATGIEIKERQYSCPACTNQWRVNEARTCNLRRYPINK